MSEYKIDPANHDWVKILEGPYQGKIGIIIRNEGCGGVFRGHYDVFLGEVADGVPVLRSFFGGKLEITDCPDPLPWSLESIAGKTLTQLPLGKSENEQ